MVTETGRCRGRGVPSIGGDGTGRLSTHLPGPGGHTEVALGGSVALSPSEPNQKAGVGEAVGWKGQGRDTGWL